VTPGFPPAQGGVESHTGALVRELAAAGVDVRVLTARRGLRRAVDEVRDGVPVRVYPAWRTTALSISPRLLFAGLRARADVVHVHSYHAACGFAALAGLVRTVVFTPHFHGDGHTPGAALLHRAYRFVGRVLFRASRAVICVSAAEAAAVRAAVPAVAGRIAVLPNGVDIAAIRAAAPFPDEPPTVLSLGRLEPYKRVAALVGAVPSLPANAQVVVVGQGSQRAELEELAAEQGVADRVRFLGVLDDAQVHRWLRTAKVLVSLSEHEAFGMAPVEAACAGARTVLSDIPAHRELVASYLGATAAIVAPDAAITQLTAPGRVAVDVPDLGETAAIVTPNDVAAAITAQLAAPGRVAVDVPDWPRIAAATLEIYRREPPA